MKEKSQDENTKGDGSCFKNGVSDAVGLWSWVLRVALYMYGSLYRALPHVHMPTVFRL